MQCKYRQHMDLRTGASNDRGNRSDLSRPRVSETRQQASMPGDGAGGAQPLIPEADPDHPGRPHHVVFWIHPLRFGKHFFNGNTDEVR